MLKIAKNILIFKFLLILIFIPFSISSSSSYSVLNMPAKTLDSVLKKREAYFEQVVSRDRMVTILIVPGHDNEYSGAVFNDIKEVEFNREVAEKLYTYLSREPGINPILAHYKNDYVEFLKTAFVFYSPEIEKFIKDSQHRFDKIKQKAELADTGFHNVALPEVRHRLYGINWWANNSNIDLIIHIHFNDYADRSNNKVGEYDGFSIYVAGEHFQNHKLSKKLGEAIFSELQKIRPVSNLPFEEKGIIEGHELIAIGSNDSVRAGSILIEYGYMYEDLFQDETKRSITFDYLAYATYSGIKKLLGENPVSKNTPTAKTTLNRITQNNLIWQFEKALEGIYPPTGKTLRDCPITGFFGECSKSIK